MSPDDTADMPAIVPTSKGSVENILTLCRRCPCRVLAEALNMSRLPELVFSFVANFGIAL